MAEGTRIKSLENALHVLLSIPADRSITVTALSQEAGLTKGSTSKILATFRDFGFVSQDAVSKEYSLGPTLIAKGYQALHNLDIRQLAKPELRLLCDKYGVHAMLMIEQSNQVVIVEILEADSPWKMGMRLGECHPYYRGAGPKVLLAYQPQWKQDRTMEEIDFVPLTDKTIRNRESLERALEEIRQQGYCISQGEIVPNAFAVAAPVFGPDGLIVASIAISGQGDTLTQAQCQAIVQDVVESAKRVSRLGGMAD